jgi:hypothetical protein
MPMTKGKIMIEGYNKYMVECGGNTCFRVYKRRSFMFVKYWSLLCVEPTFDCAAKLVDNLYRINSKG